MGFYDINPDPNHSEGWKHVHPKHAAPADVLENRGVEQCGQQVAQLP
jgi:hypothetical protein